MRIEALGAPDRPGLQAILEPMICAPLREHVDFDITGTQPGAGQHPTLGLVDAYVMYRQL